MRCVLVGNYGVANLGDEALKDYFLGAFPSIEWITLSARPLKGELPRLPAGLRSLLLTPWWKTVRAIRRADALVFGGGTLFTDIESPLACFLWFLHAKAAYLLGTPYFLAFQGVGPFRTRVGKILSSWVIRHAAFVSVRDEESMRRVEELCMNTKCVLSFDPVILTIQIEDLKRTKNVINFIPRHNSGLPFLNAVSRAITDFPRADIAVILMQPDDEKEQLIAQKILTLAAGRGAILPVRSLTELCTALAGSFCTVSERYHGVLAALTLGAPVRVVAQAQGDKLSMLVPYALGQASFGEAFDLARAGQEALRGVLETV